MRYLKSSNTLNTLIKLLISNISKLTKLWAGETVSAGHVLRRIGIRSLHDYVGVIAEDVQNPTLRHSRLLSSLLGGFRQGNYSVSLVYDRSIDSNVA